MIDNNSADNDLPPSGGLGGGGVGGAGEGGGVRGYAASSTRLQRQHASSSSSSSLMTVSKVVMLGGAGGGAGGGGEYYGSPGGGGRRGDAGGGRRGGPVGGGGSHRAGGVVGGVGGKKGVGHHQVPDDLRTVDSTLLYETLKHFFVVLKLAGIFYVRAPGHDARRFNHAQIYCGVVSTVLLLNMLRSLATFESFNTFDYVLSFKLTWLVLWYEGLSRASFANYLWYRKKGGLQDLFIRMDSMFYTDGIIPYDASLRRMQYSLLAATATAVIVCVVVFGYAFFSNIPDLETIYTPSLLPYIPGVDMPLALDYVVEIVVLIIVAVNTWSSMLYMCLYTIVCYVLYKEFEYLGRTFEMKIAPDGTFTDDMDRFRSAHQNRMVESVDLLFKKFIANSYMAEIPAICLIMYCLLEPAQTVHTRISGLFWFIYLTAHTVTISVAAIAVNTQAHFILSYIYGVKASNSTEDRQIELAMFLNKLTGTPIGLTAWDMFVVNKPTILTIVGLVMTLFFLLMQFGNPLQPVITVNCACETNLTNNNQ